MCNLVVWALYKLKRKKPTNEKLACFEIRSFPFQWLQCFFSHFFFWDSTNFSKTFMSVINEKALIILCFLRPLKVKLFRLWRTFVQHANFLSSEWLRLNIYSPYSVHGLITCFNTTIRSIIFTSLPPYFYSNPSHFTPNQNDLVIYIIIWIDIYL